MTERTTVRLPEDLIRQAKRKAAAEGRSLTALIEDGLRRVLREPEPAGGRGRVLPPVSAAAVGSSLESISTIRPRCRRWTISYSPAGSNDPSRRQCADLCFPQDSPRHTGSKPWLDSVVRGDAQFGLSPLTLSAVARILTNPRVFKEPSPIAEAFAFCDNLLGQPHCEVVRPGSRHWTIFTRICLESGVRGPRVSDAWFAALAIEHGCTWITYDRDYARFPELDWRTPAP